MKQAIRFALQMYKRWVSPALPHSCRFVPTCSEYAMEAVEGHGALRGSRLAMARLLRCQPFARAGYDPVPQVGGHGFSRAVRGSGNKWLQLRASWLKPSVSRRDSAGLKSGASTRADRKLNLA